MQGFWLSFIVPLGRTKGAVSIVDWLRHEAVRLGVEGLTVSMAEGGYGRDGEYRSVHFFETGEQPVIVSMAVSRELSETLFTRIRNAGLEIFYTKTPIEYGVAGADSADSAEAPLSV